MKAVWYEKTGAAEVLCFGEMEMPSLAAGEVLVRVCASGVNPSDVKIRAGARGAMAFPRQIPHSDGAGIIEAVGEGVLASRIGERVWLWNAAIGRAHGTCAEYIAVPEKQAVALHEKTEFLQGACFGVPLMTAVYGVLGDGAVDGQTILVTGAAGAVGHYAVQVARLSGAQVLTTVSCDEKKAHAKTANPDCIINYKEQNVAECVLDITNGVGVDRIVEVEFGGNLQTTDKILKSGGIIAAYGAMAVSEPMLPFYSLMLKNITLKMFLIYGISEAARLGVINKIEKMEAALTHAVSLSLPLSQTQEAHEVVESGAQIGKTVVVMEPS